MTSSFSSNVFLNGFHNLVRCFIAIFFNVFWNLPNSNLFAIIRFICNNLLKLSTPAQIPTIISNFHTPCLHLSANLQININATYVKLIFSPKNEIHNSIHCVSAFLTTFLLFYKSSWSYLLVSSNFFAHVQFKEANQRSKLWELWIQYYLTKISVK